MKWKRLFVLVLITLILILAIFFYKYNSPLVNIEEDLITYFEKKSNLDIEYEEINYWPLNRLTLKGLKLSKDDTLLISIPEIKIYYDIKEIIVAPQKWLAGLKYISAKEPGVFITDIDALRDKQYNFFSKLSSEIEIEVSNGRIVVEDEKNKILVNDIQAFLQGDKLKIEAGANLEEISFSGFNSSDLKIKKMGMTINIKEKLWQGTLMTGSFSLPALVELIELSPEIKNMISEGSGQALVHFKGFKSKLRDYEAKITVNDGVLGFTQPDFLKSGEINNINGEIYFNSGEKDIKLNDFNFTYRNNNFNFGGIISALPGKIPQIKAQIRADNLELSHCGLALPEFNQLEPAGKARLNLLVDGDINSPEIDIDFYLPEGKIGGELITYLRTHIRYSHKLFYIDSLDLELTRGSFLKLSGLYDIDSELYSFSGQGNNIDTEVIKKYLPSTLPVDNINGKLNFDLIFNGQGLNFANMNARGEVRLVANNVYNQLRSKIWLADRVIMFTGGLFAFPESDINFSGELNLANNDINFKFAGKDINTDLLNSLVDTDIPFSGNKIDFMGSVVNNINSPEFNINLSLARGEINELKFENLRAQAVYKNKKIYIDDLRFNSYSAEIKGSAVVDMGVNIPELEANLHVSNMDCREVVNIFSSPLPLRGTIDKAELTIRGSLDNPLIQGTTSSKQLFVNIDDKEFPFHDTSISFNWRKESSLVIDKLQAKQNDAELLLNGSITGNYLDFDFKIGNFVFSSLELEEDINARLDLEGKITGNKNSPVITGNIIAEDILLYEKKLHSLQGKFSYNQEKLAFKKVKLDIGPGEYILNGIVENIFADDINTEMKIKIREGKLAQIMTLFDYDFPLQQEFLINGNAEISGSLQELKAGISMEARAVEDSAGYINLEGEIGKRLDLEVMGENVIIADIYEIYPELDLVFETGVSFKGKIRGSLDELSLNLQTETGSVKLNKEIIDKITGYVSLKEGEILNLQQVIAKDGSELEITGELNLNDKSKFDLDINLKEFPLHVVTGILLPAQKREIKGYLQGMLNIGADKGDLTTAGRIFLTGEDIDLGLEEKIDFVRGEMVFRGKEIVLKDFKGQYASQPINIEGKLFPFEEENIWDINLSGRNLSYDMGSLEGSFDPEISIQGSLLSPRIKGELLVYDLIIDLPFEFRNNNQEGLFQPELDVVMKAGEDIYIRNQYLDILVQEGSLRLTNEGNNYFLEGRVDSRQGSFDYYNNKFILENGYADFRRFNDNVPEISATAYTYVKGVKIYINIKGLADNMLMTFYSEPELPREEIIDLLVSKGGLGELTSEGKTSIPNFIKKELARFFRESFQLEFIQDLEDTFKKIFELDRMEIDTYELGFSENISIYLGKRIGEKSYLQYVKTFNLDDMVKDSEGESELSFSYYLNDKTHLEGSWLGEDEFRLSIETEIKF